MTATTQRRFHMKKKHTHISRKTSFLTLGLFVLLIALLTACDSGSTGNNGTANVNENPTTTNNSSTNATSTPTTNNANNDSGSTQNNKPTSTANTPAAQVYHIKVFFSKKGDTSFTSVYPVARTTNSQAVATAAIQYLIDGPNASEQQQGYYSELGSMLQGPASCPNGSNADFIIKLNTKGSTAEQGTATLQFCHDTASAGVGMDARVKTQIEATLKQFPTIHKVVILTKNGTCFGDESGSNVCLK